MQARHAELQSDADELELRCPTCGADLFSDEQFLEFRVCSGCGRHFSISAAERCALLLDEGTYRPIPADASSIEALDLDQVSPVDRASGHRERHTLDEAVVTGVGSISGMQSVVVVLDDQLLGANVGAVAGEKILVALEHALTRKLPVVMVLAGRNSRSHAGPLALVQGARFITMAARLQMACLPMIAVLTHPTSAGMFSVIASQCDVILAEPGTHVGVTWTGDVSVDAAGRLIDARDLVTGGMIDGIVDRARQPEWIGDLLAIVAGRMPIRSMPSAPPGRSLDTPFAELFRCRVELRGDRTDNDDPRIRAGFGVLNDRPVAFAVQDPNVEEGAGSAGALRKIQRIARMAGRFELPLVLLVQAPERPARAEMVPAESLGCAKLGSMMAMLPVPVISVGAGIVRGTLGNIMMAGDRRLLLEHARYQLVMGDTQRPVRAPRGTGREPFTITWSPRDCARFGLVDTVIPAEGDGSVVARLTDTIDAAIGNLSAMGPRRLVETRHQRHRLLGQETEAGMAAFRLELHEWNDVQQSVSRSIDELRERIGARLEHPGRFAFQKPDLNDLAQRVRARRDVLRHDLLERSGRITGDKGHEA